MLWNHVCETTWKVKGTFGHLLLFSELTFFLTIREVLESFGSFSETQETPFLLLESHMCFDSFGLSCFLFCFFNESWDVRKGPHPSSNGPFPGVRPWIQG